MTWIQLPDATLHYWEYGNGPCVVFMHGSGGNHLSWWQQIPVVSRHYRCLVPDLRGYGLSWTKTPPHDAGVFSDDIRLLLEHLKVARAHVVGQSIGGHYALRFALANPECVHGLVLADTLAGIADGRIAEIKAAADPVPKDLFERALGVRFRTQQENLTQLYRMIEGLNHAGTDPPILAPVADVAAAELADLKAPTLLVVGEHDPVAPAAAVAVAAGLIPRARFKMIPDCGHSPYFEQPDAFNDALLEFLDILG